MHENTDLRRQWQQIFEDCPPERRQELLTEIKMHNPPRRDIPMKKYWKPIAILLASACILLFAVDLLLPDVAPAEPSEAQIQTAQAELLAAAPTDTSAPAEPPTATPYPVVWIVCHECVEEGDEIGITLWETPDNMGANRPMVYHGYQCQLIQSASSSEGISKVEVTCAGDQGWIRADGVSFAAP